MNMDCFVLKQHTRSNSRNYVFQFTFSFIVDFIQNELIIYYINFFFFFCKLKCVHSQGFSARTIEWAWFSDVADRIITS